MAKADPQLAAGLPVSLFHYAELRRSQTRLQLNGSNIRQGQLILAECFEQTDLIDSANHARRELNWNSLI
mgnify:CR=1 FL=1